ncbi:molybdopterin-dependent oxidoreductase [Nocardioides acrostichi]|uniref:Molybdopterin-dependent oxidoreductase n=1 Tax=Nocardioides acrostichi TaxID=2784339 RepID=A0A930YA90_9ACTN|nr:molybdopterin-dependent oxidoreductase [Nocardioides acrostichi]MBF4161168.1 molybdopterin-dependent oxidoreductase [Nocardioides acrostichi]
MRPISRLLWALLGVVSTMLGMAVGHFAASLVDTSSSPVLAVGSTVIDATPTPLKDWAIRNFGSNDKTVLIGSVLVVVLLLAAVAGLLARRRFVYGAVFEGVLVLVAAVMVVLRPGFGGLDLLPAVLTAIAGIGSLYLLARLATRPTVKGAEHDVEHDAGHEDSATAGPSRRGVLIGAGVVTIAAAVLAGAGRLITSLKASPADVTLPEPADPAPAFPSDDLAQKYGITPLRIDNNDFYRVDTRLDVPIVDPGSWSLTIDGDVDQEVTFTFEDLLGMELIERDITLTCVSNSVGGEYVGGARWLGVRLTDLLDKAGVGSKADQIFSTDVDGMTISTPLEVATDGRDSMIAIGMNGEALPREHGFPARMIVPGLYGFVSACKWITKMTLTTYDQDKAYWTDRDWATKAPIKISARIDTPDSLAQLDAGDQIVGGVAWAQESGGVKKVQVRIDGGAWTDATMGPDVNNDYWRQWYYQWKDAKPGAHSIAARVIDGNGQTQTAARAMPFPDGASGIESLQVTVS